MGSCYSGDHIARDHTHKDRTTCNIVEPQQKYCFGTIRNKLLGVEAGATMVRNMKHLVRMKVS